MSELLDPRGAPPVSTSEKRLFITPFIVKHRKQNKMQKAFTSHHFHDANKLPSGGHVYGTGFAIAWQSGPLGRGEERKTPNGAFVEDVIAAVVDRLEWYQASGFSCFENANALRHLRDALAVLESRTKRREIAGIEGTHVEDPRQ